MIVVADAGPLNYLLLSGAANVLEPLYERVVVPSAAAAELGDPGAPPLVQTWIAKPPEWCEIRPDPASDATLNHLDPGERAAIYLAVSLNADRLLIDERAGRAEAERRGLTITGTWGACSGSRARSA